MDDTLKKGQVLKQARIAKGISLESVHEATKIPLDALKAIEEGYTIRSMTPFYYRGFLKIYSRYLGVDIGQDVESERKEKERESSIPSYFAGKKEDIVPKKIFPEVSPAVKLWAIRIIVGILALFSVVKIGQAIGRHWHSRVVKVDSRNKTKDVKNPFKSRLPLKAEKPKDSETPAVLKEPIVVSKEDPKKVEARREESKNQEAHKKIELAIRAKKDSWLQVTVDGEVVFRSTLKKGSVETWHADKNMEISGKDIGELEFELNGKIIGPLSKENRRAKKVLIDQNGFSVK